MTVSVGEADSLAKADFYLIQGSVASASPVNLETKLWSLSNGKLTFQRSLSSKSEGIYFIQEDNLGEQIIATPQAAPTAVTVLSRLQPSGERRWTSDEGVQPIFKSALISESVEFGLALCVPLAIKKPKDERNIEVVPLGGTSRKAIRVSATEALFQDFFFSGIAGGGEAQPVPVGRAVGGKFTLGEGGTTVPLMVLPPSLAKMTEGSQIAIVAATHRYVVLSIPRNPKELESEGGEGRLSLSILDRLTHQWSSVQLPGNVSRSRVFGDWLVSIQETWHQDNETNPGRRLEAPEIEQSFKFGEGSFARIPGVLTLLHLSDGRRYRIVTNAENSEILGVQGTSVLYRVNGTLYMGRIGKDEVDETKLLATDPAIENVHWAF